MAWIESHQELARHPKTKALARLLGVSLPCTIGYLHLLWWWAVDYAKDGSLARFRPAHIADAVLWEGDPDLLWISLIEAGFIDDVDGPTIHDWGEYAGKLLERRRSDADRKRSLRLGLPLNRDVQQTSGGHPLEGARTGPNLTGQYLTGPDSTGSASLASDVSPDGDAHAEKPKPQKHKPITDEYIAELVVEFAPQLGGPECVRERIERAMNHKASDGWKDKRRGLHDWLRRDVERLTNGQQSTRASPNGKPALSAAAQRFVGVERTFGAEGEIAGQEAGP